MMLLKFLQVTAASANYIPMTRNCYSSTESCAQLQDKLNDLIQWPETWHQLKISQNESAAMYIHEA
jgi:DNA-binding HxlR family transcriptional regulator